MKPFFGRVRKFKKSGGYCYLSAKLVDNDAFPFKDDSVVKIEVDDVGKRLTVSIPEWWELLDWNKMPDVFERLGDDLKERIMQAGLVESRRTE